VPTEILPVQSLRAERAKRAQAGQHVIAALTLLFNAWPHLRHQPGLLPILETAAAALLIGAAVRDHVRRRRGAHHEAVGWVEIAGAAMTFVEAMARTRERHHLSFLVLSFVQPALLLLFGILDVRIASMRMVRVDDDGVELRLGLLFARRVRWEELRGFRIAGNKFEFDLTDGRARTFNLRLVKNREEVMAWIAERLRGRGVEELPPP
jgi:hypothetical protein